MLTATASSGLNVCNSHATEAGIKRIERAQAQGVLKPSLKVISWKPAMNKPAFEAYSPEALHRPDCIGVIGKNMNNKLVVGELEQGRIHALGQVKKARKKTTRLGGSVRTKLKLANKTVHNKRSPDGTRLVLAELNGAKNHTVPITIEVRPENVNGQDPSISFHIGKHRVTLDPLLSDKPPVVDWRLSLVPRTSEPLRDVARFTEPTGCFSVDE